MPELVWRPAPPDAASPGAWPPVLVAEGLLELGVVAAFTARLGGRSAPPYATCNLALRVGDDVPAVLANRRRVATVLGLAGAPIATVRQVHSATAVVAAADALGPGPPEARPPLAEADALVTAARGLALATLAADCVPVLLADPGAGVVGAAHAGWRGLAGGIVEAAVEALAALGARPEATVALVGPSICGRCYEVGEDVQAAVTAGHPAAAAVTRAGPPALDVAAGVGAALRRAGVPAVVTAAGECTFERPDRYFSYRRERRTGRQAGIIALVRGGGERTSR